MIARLFKTPDGKKVLSYWEERYIKAPVCVPTQPAEQGYYREGQNSVIRTIQNAIKRRTNGDYLPQGDNDE